MNRFYMLIGFPASGKSTYAQELAKSTGGTVFSSDEYRKRLYGSEAVQDHNEEIFNRIMVDMQEALREGQIVIYDAQNISSRYRRHTINMIKKHASEIIGILVATPYEECLRRNQLRERHVPEYVIKRSYMNFTVPTIKEGFTDIGIIFPKNFEFRSAPIVVREMYEIEHNNYHHSYTIGKHMRAALEYLKKNYQEEYETDEALRVATLVHDIGKPFTKTFVNMKGETTEDAHYYGHNNVGAYESLFLNVPAEIKIEIALLVQYHMNYYMSWKQSEKSRKNDEKFLGKEFMKKLDILHTCDINAH